MRSPGVTRGYALSDAAERVAVLALGRLHLLRLEVVGQAPCVPPPHAHGTIDEVSRLRRMHASVAKGRRYILEKALQIHLLLIVASERRARLVAHDREHGLVVLTCVVESACDCSRVGPRAPRPPGSM
jgi:hypothetical protein